jgi:S-(hydroxymethyl)glutathione dehydrogenase/alcohol dehydrogenase
VVEKARTSPQIEEITLADLQPDEVCVRICVSGVCHTDVAWAAGELFDEFPVVLGHESAGVVESVGSLVQRCKPGDRVVLALSHHCGHCFYCETGRPMLCDQRTQPHPRLFRDGKCLVQGYGAAGFAERTIVREGSVIAVPDGVPLPVAAVVGCATSTGLGAVLNIAHVPAGAQVVVLGAGGVGLNVVMGCKLAGAERIIVVDPKPERREFARQFGATDAIDSQEELAFELRPQGFDYVFESAGAAAAMELAIRLTAKGGTAVLIGAVPPGTQVRFDALSIVGAQRRILGCLTGNVRPDIDFARYFALYQRGLLDLDHLITTIMPFEEISEAFQWTLRGHGIRTLVRIGEE